MREQGTLSEELRKVNDAVDELKKAFCLSPIGVFLYKCLDVANILLNTIKEHKTAVFAYFK